MDSERNAPVDTRQLFKNSALLTVFGRKRVPAMADFNELLIQAYRLLDTARMLSDDSKRNGINFVNTELDLSMTLAERALVSAEQL